MLDRTEWQRRWRKADTFVIDLDGTLLDTLGDLQAACNHAMAVFALPPRTRDDIRWFIGDGIRKLLERAVPDSAHLHPEEFSQLESAFHTYYREHLWDCTRIYPGVPEVLTALQSRGAKLAVLTNKPQAAAEALCRHFFAGTFVEVIGQEEGRAKKPDPAELLALLERLETSPERTILLGDSEVDMITAGNAGVTAAGAAWGFRSREVLETNGADGILTQAGEILALL